jgi:hypothetical protein
MLQKEQRSKYPMFVGYIMMHTPKFGWRLLIPRSIYVVGHGASIIIGPENSISRNLFVGSVSHC